MLDNNLNVLDAKGLQKLIHLINNLTHTNLFPFLLSKDYVRVADNKYRKDNEIIEIANVRGEWIYRNRNCVYDYGNIVQFIANRHTGTLLKCEDVSIIHESALTAKVVYHNAKKRLRCISDHSNRPIETGRRSSFPYRKQERQF